MKTIHAIVLCRAYYPVCRDVPDDYTIEDAVEEIRELLPYIPADDMEWEADEEIVDAKFI